MFLNVFISLNFYSEINSVVIDISLDMFCCYKVAIEKRDTKDALFPKACRFFPCS